MSVVMSISSLNRVVVVFCKLVEKSSETEAPEVTQACANALAAAEAWLSTPASCVVFVTRVRMPAASWA